MTRRPDDRMMRLRSPLCILLLFAAAGSVWAVDPGQPVSSYIHIRFTAEDGLPSNIVDQMVQSQDGFLMVLAGGRLARFDGRHFDFYPFEQLGVIRTIALAEDGDLWIGTYNDLKRIPAAVLNQSGRVRTISYHPDPGRRSFIASLHVTRSGVLWIGTADGLYRFENGVFSVAMPRAYIIRIEEASNGHLLVITGDGLVEWDGSRVVPHPELAAQLGLKDIYHVFEDSHRITWFCTPNGVARRIGASIEKLAPWGPGHGAFRAYEDPSGTLWFIGAEGLFRATAAGLELAVEGMNARYIYGDQDGNLWVGTNGDGLHRFKDRAVRMFTADDGLPNNAAMTVLTTHDGAVWSGFNCGGIARFDGHGFRIYNEKNGLLNSCVYSLAEDANHDLWIGTYGGGVFRMHEGRFTQYSKAQGLPSDIVTGILVAHDGSIWLITALGVSCMREGAIRNYTVSEGYSDAAPFALYEDRKGGIWVGTFHGIEHLSSDRFVNFSFLPRSPLFPLGEDRSGSLYFSADPSGEIYQAKGDQVIGIASTPGEAEMMVETEQGDLWLVGHGIWRVPRGALDHHHQTDEPLDFAVFGSADGLAATMASDGRPNLTLTPDGRLWIATTQGLAMLDLPHLPRTDRKPAIYIQEVTVGRNKQPPGNELVLPPGTHRLELPFDAVEVSSPERIRLQYRLDSVDSEWLDAATPARAIYTNMPPGKHAFHIRACNRDGIWDRTGTVFYITQLPYFYETGWFRAAMVMAGLLLLWGLYRLRLRQATVRVTTRLEGRLAERSRIARELHDTLLQSFQGVVFLFQGATKLLPAGEAKQKFEGALDEAEHAIIEGRDAVYEMRSSEAASELSTAISAFAEELTAASTSEHPPVIRMQVEDAPRRLNPVLRDEVYRIAVEALRNAFQHAQAHQIEVEITYGERQLVLRVRDDGKGVDADILDHGRAGHFGLPGMRERAKLIGASLEVRSTPGSGTEVELAVPASIAYAKSNDGRRWRWFFWRKGLS